MNYIVLVKQVPDVSNIPEDAWDREKGTLKRGVLSNVLNPLDLHALTFACQMKEKTNSRSKVVCLTMGPPQAKEVLIDSLSRGADDAVLLTDRGFAGADTVATAYSLAKAVQKIEKEIFKNKEYIIVSGMQSVDGDTAQVPGQVAEELGIEYVAYAQSFSLDNNLSVKRIGPHGTEVIGIKEYPVLITTTGCTEPLYQSFHKTRKANKKEIIKWSAEDVGAEKERIGLGGSRTQVYRIFSPSESRKKKCIFLNSVKEIIDLIEKKYKEGASSDSGDSEKLYELGNKTSSYSGEVWVYAEHYGSSINTVSYELLSKARELAKSLNTKVGAVLVGHNISGLSEALIKAGADKVYLSENPILENFLPIPYKKVISAMVKEYKPQIMLFGATPLGRELAPRVAYSASSGLTADCTKLEIDDFERGKIKLTAIMKQTRPALGGNIMATIMTKDSITQMATVRPGILKANTFDKNRKSEVISFEANVTETDCKTEIISTEEVSSDTNLAEADIVIAGGRGIGSKANFNKYIKAFSEAFEGFLKGHIEVGASRMAVEEGFIGRDHQVGQTGQAVQPKLYIAVGISGAVQHISGMQNSDMIVAINKDAHAGIFNYTDCGMVGDFQTIVPELIEEIKRRVS